MDGFTYLCLLFQLILTVGFGISGEEYEAPATVGLGRLLRNYVGVKQGSSFKMALFADLHFGEDAWTSWGPLQDVKSIRVMSTVLDHETPGDICPK